ncbi:MAG: hypothetical protein PVJ05_12560 [Candidatus Thorarchaeota archaeon]|jgi:hypothetical protein
MANEEKVRVETPEEEEKPVERKGLLKPLPTREEPKYTDKDGRPQPIVKLLGLSMPEKRRDLLILILIPALIGIIDTTLFSYVFTHTLPTDATYVFFIPIIIAIPIGLTASEAGNALMGGFLGAVFFFLFFVTFLSSPGLIIPDLGLGTFVFNAIALSIVYFVLVALATLFGTIIGVILREFL